jgi:NAD(P)-dependent dehydrogenase (short-subunit alcohol dehydrogenase family)
VAERPVLCLTGAAGGIGLATALRFLRQGWRVALIVRTVDAKERLQAVLAEYSDVSKLYVVDVSQLGRIQSVVTEVATDFGRLDALVNNAGVEGIRSLTDVSEADFELIMTVNLGATVFFCRSAVEVMGRRRSGSIVNVASQAGLVGEPFNSLYSASKFGVVGFTQSIAQELAGSGIRANCVCPGPIATDLLDRSIEKFAAYYGESPGAVFQRIATRVPGGEIGAPDDVAGAILFLCGPQARFITGASVAVTGGAVMH